MEHDWEIHGGELTEVERLAARKFMREWTGAKPFSPNETKLVKVSSAITVGIGGFIGVAIAVQPLLKLFTSIKEVL